MATEKFRCANCRKQVERQKDNSINKPQRRYCGIPCRVEGERNRSRAWVSGLGDMT